MRILSQDEESVVSTENVDSICIMETQTGRFQISAFNGLQESEIILGFYESDEYATEVIKAIFTCTRDRFVMPEDGEVDET